jgi:hypothetical protein
MSQTQPPKMNPVRRNARVGPLLLPREGRKGPSPAWPLPGRQLKTEKELWETLWHSPQAAAWETMGDATVRVVARYARYVIMAELGNDKAAAEARQLEDKLGVTPKAMRMLLWAVAADEVGEKRDEQVASATAQADVRSRIRAVG